MTPAPDKFDFDKCHNAKRCKGCDDYYGRMKQENRELREALEKIQNFKVKLFDKNLTMMDVILHDKRVAKEALESPLDKQGNGEKL